MNQGASSASRRPACTSSAAPLSSEIPDARRRGGVDHALLQQSAVGHHRGQFDTQGQPLTRHSRCVKSVMTRRRITDS